MTTVELAADVRAVLGEGPIWDDRLERLVFVDIHGRAIHVFNPADGAVRTIKVSVPVSALAPTDHGDWVAAGGQGFLRIDPATGTETPIIRVERPERRTRMNDGYVDTAGRFWAGSMSLDGTAGQGTLYRLDPDLSVHDVLTPVTTSNGPAWSPDGRLMYYVDTRTRRIDLFDFDNERGAISGRRVFVDFGDGPGRPDGVIVDSDGGVWVALWAGSAVRRYLPDGRLDLEIAVPSTSATKCAFGGPDLGDLYITTAASATPEASRPAQPHAGGLFRVRTGATGQRVSRFRG